MEPTVKEDEWSDLEIKYVPACLALAMDYPILWDSYSSVGWGR